MESRQQKANCPYCRTKDVAFTIKCYGEQQSDSYVGLTRWFKLTDTFAVCGRCSRAVVMTFMNDGRKFSTVRIAPSPPEPPEHLPSNIGKFFQQGMNNLPDNFDAAGAMFRKALDVALKKKFPEIKGTLKERITKAAKENKMTCDLAKWADQIRLDGNEAAHGEEPFSQKDAQRLSTFTELVLLYLYTLPGMLKRAQAPPEPQSPAKKPNQPPVIEPWRNLPG